MSPRVPGPPLRGEAAAAFPRRYCSRDLRVTRLGWLLAALLLAVPFAYGTFFASDGNSCGAFDSGPNRGAEERFCGFGPTNPTNGPVTIGDHSAVFVFVNLVPASIVVVGGLLATLGLSRWFFPAGIVLGVLSAVVLFTLEP